MKRYIMRVGLIYYIQNIPIHPLPSTAICPPIPSSLLWTIVVVVCTDICYPAIIIIIIIIIVGLGPMRRVQHLLCGTWLLLCFCVDRRSTMGTWLSME